MFLSVPTQWRFDPSSVSKARLGKALTEKLGRRQGKTCKASEGLKPDRGTKKGKTMKGNVKNMAQGLVVSEKSPIFALPNQRISANQYIVDSTLWAYPCSTSALRSCAGLATEGGTPSFYTYNTTFDGLCQTRSKVCRRTIVTDPHPITSIGSCRAAKSCGFNSHTRSSSALKSTVSRRLRSIVTLRLSRPARHFWRSVQRSSSSSIEGLLCASTIFLFIGASSRNLNPLAL